MKVEEFVDETRRDWKRKGPIDRHCMMCVAFDTIEQALSIIESQRVALRDTCQRLNESGPGEMSLVNTIHDAHRIARQELDKEV